MKSAELPEDLLEIEHQLSAPHGEVGIAVANKMNEGNIGMTRSSYNALNISDNEKILEIGHGNCGHLEEIMKQANNISFCGLEISETMKAEAERINSSFCQKNLAEFQLYDGLKLPFNDNIFNSVLTVNSIYFWSKPIDLLNEIYRVLKPNGKLAIGYAQKDCMKTLPFVQDRFSLFNDEGIKDLIEKTSFKILSISPFEDDIETKVGNIVHRTYSVALLQK